MNLNMKEFKEKISKRQIRLSVVGLGYVGLNISCLFAKNGFTVSGFDVNENKIEKLRNNINPIPEETWLTPYISKISVSTDVKLAPLKGDIVFLALPTPFIGNKTDLRFLVSAIRNLGNNIKGKILVFESTVPPGTTQKLVKELLELKTGLTAGKDFWFAHSPERIDPSSTKHFIWNTPKIVGGNDHFSTEIVTFLYSQAIEKVIPVSDPITAEFVKVIENTQRNVNIALVNLFAIITDKLNIDVYEALNAAATKWNFINFKPGCGVGGECIDDSTRMLAEVMDEINLDSTLIKESTKINAYMPYFTMDKVLESAKTIGVNLRNIRIGILGLAYKGNSSDIRNSPSLKIIEALKKAGCEHIFAYDPLVNENIEFGVQRVNSLKKTLEYVDFVIIATDHDEFKSIDVSLFNKCNVNVIVDGRNCLKKEKVESKGIIYCGIGR